jgi:xanthine dehydrogenase YagR molybdenum-binding subunit
MRDGHARVGWGMAASVYPARRSPASARARLNPDGSALVEAGSQDLGGGTYTIMTQIAADQLGLPVSAVTFLLAIRAFPKLPSGGSQTAATCGSAVYEATRALRQKILDLAHVPAADADQLRIENGRVTAGSTSVPIADLLKQTGQSHLDAQASTKPGDETKQYSMFSFGAQFADLGQIEVTRMTGVFDAGRILNAKTARSQFIGGMVWGISMALHERNDYDTRLVRIVNNNLAEYHVPTNADVPAIDIAWIDGADDRVSPIGARGIGEIGITGASAAIANAVFHATGTRIRDLPITPDKLL